MGKSSQFRNFRSFWSEAPNEASLYRGANITHAASHTRVAELLYLPSLTVLCILDPDAIIVGGLPSLATEHLCFHLNQRLAMNVAIHWPSRAVLPAKVTEDAAAVGASVLALQTIWEPPSS